MTDEQKDEVRNSLREVYLKNKGVHIVVTEGDYSYFLESKIIELGNEIVKSQMQNILGVKSHF